MFNFLYSHFTQANTTLEEELNNIDIKMKATDSEMEQYLQEIEKQKGYKLNFQL